MKEFLIEIILLSGIGYINILLWIFIKTKNERKT